MASEFLVVAQQVLDRERRPLRAKEIVSLAILDGLFSDKRAGKTPHQTMKSKLSVHIRKHGSDSPFVRTAPGKFFLRSLLDEHQTAFHAKPLSKPVSREAVLVFDSDWLPPDTRFQGINKRWRRLYRQLLRPSVCRYLPRLEAEANDGYKQVVTYIVVTRGNSVLAYKRGNFSRVEDSLKGSHCIGFGGHVINADRSLFTTEGMGVWEASVRELSEELSLGAVDRKRLLSGEGLQIVGVLNDDSSANGRRHFAFVFRFELTAGNKLDVPAKGEKAITQLRWINPSDHKVHVWDFEYWSQLCLREYFPGLVRTIPSFRIRRRRALQDEHVLCIVGTLGSGKSEATRVLCDDFRYEEVNTGRILAKLMRVEPVPATPREVFQRLALKYIQSESGPNRLASAIAAEARRRKSSRLLIDGVRQLATLKALTDELGAQRLSLLYVHAPPDLAFLLYRQRERSNATFGDFIAMRDAPVEMEIPGLIGHADAVLYNWIGVAAYRRAIRQMMLTLQERR